MPAAQITPVGKNSDKPYELHVGQECYMLTSTGNQQFPEFDRTEQ